MENKGNLLFVSTICTALFFQVLHIHLNLIGRFYVHVRSQFNWSILRTCSFSRSVNAKFSIPSFFSIYFGRSVLEIEVKGRVGRKPVKLRMMQKSQSIPEIQEDWTVDFTVIKIKSVGGYHIKSLKKNSSIELIQPANRKDSSVSWQPTHTALCC